VLFPPDMDDSDNEGRLTKMKSTNESEEKRECQDRARERDR
jgi:hypothetical protein